MSDDRLEDEPEGENVETDVEQIVNDALDSNDDDDDGHIPPDLYGEAEPDEEVDDNHAYDYKNDYYQAQPAPVAAAQAPAPSGLSW